MKYSMTWMAGCTICAFAGVAQADCAADLARFTDMAAVTSESADPAASDAEGISKDGSLAPLEDPEDDSAQADASNAAADAPADTATDKDTFEGIAKDGSLAPLEGTEAEPGTAIAMSGSDAQAQQEGQLTAAEEADGAEAMQERDTLIADAESALAAGDEAACQDAVDRLEAM